MKKTPASILAPGGKVSDFSPASIEQNVAGRGNEGYRDAVRALLFFIKLELFFIVVVSVLLILLLREGRPEDRFYAMAFNNRAMSMQGLKEPSFNLNSMLSWVSQTTSEIMSFGFSDVNERLLASQQYFTDVGWESFRLSMTQSALLRTIFQNQQIMTAVPVGVPKVVWAGLRRGEWVWDVEVPIMLTVRAGKHSARARPTLIVVVKQVPTQRNPRGLGIEQWMMF